MNQEIKEKIIQIGHGIILEGYKKTDDGICPIDWGKHYFKDLYDFYGGLGIPREKLGKTGVLYLHYGDMHTSEKMYIDLDKDIDKLPRYDKNVSKDQMLLNGDIVFVDASEDYEGTCKTFVIYNKNDLPLVAGLHTFFGRNKTNLLNIDFQKYLTKIPEIKKQIFKYVQGYKVYGISRENISKIYVNLPNNDEQENIAKILDCATKQVELQEQLVDKLKVQKKALMQKLLTPQPDWQEVKLGDICKITTGKLDANEMVENGKYPFFTCSKDIYKIDKYAYDMEALLMAGNGEIGDIKYYNGKFNAYQRTYILYNFKFNIKYAMQYLLLHFNKAVCKGSQKSSMPYIRVDLLNNAKILYPQNLDQIAIFLENFDKKIELQQKLLEQYKLRQKALMQLLLTGIVRVD